MPELPEVETVCRGLSTSMLNVKIRKVEQKRHNLRFPFPENFSDGLNGQTITAITRRAKYILAHLSNKMFLVIHLGMSGRFTIFEKQNEDTPGNYQHKLNVNPVHDHVIFHMSNGTKIHYNDARRFGFMTLIPENQLEDHKYFRHLGIEPLDRTFTAKHLAQLALNKNTSLKAFLLDQHTIAGLGNIYVCEALYRAKLSPKSPASILTEPNGMANLKTKTLVKVIKKVLKEAIEAGGSTLKDHQKTDGSLGYFQHSFKVYGLEGAMCKRKNCKGMIERITQNGRSTFYCSHCQS